MTFSFEWVDGVKVLPGLKTKPGGGLDTGIAREQRTHRRNRFGEATTYAISSREAGHTRESIPGK
jgi:hypothetical protein